MLKLYKPFKPFHITQRWGVANPIYRANGIAMDEHNGVDANRGKAEKEYLVYCPAEGLKVSQIRHRPNGGGNEIWLISKLPVMLGGEECYPYLVMMHNKKVLVPVGYEPALGELITVGDNTGFSTGPHTHIGLYRLDEKWNPIDKNNADNSYPPVFEEEYSVDKASVQTLVKSGLRYYKYLLTL